MNSIRTLVIVGGGFAGTTLARALDGRLPSGVELLLLSDESYTTFNPMLPEAVGASIFPEQVVAPIREMLSARHGSRFIMGSVKSVDVAANCLSVNTLAGSRTVQFDQLVLAYGNRAHLDLLPGMAEHALPLKTVGDAMHIRNVVLRRIARIELEASPEVRARLGHFVVIGGGFSGVEVAGELVDCLVSIRRYYPRVAASELKVTILHDMARLLPELPPELGDAALQSLRVRHVDVQLGVRAAAIFDDRVQLASGAELPAATVICTIGTRPNGLSARLALPLERGRIVTNADLSVPGHPNIWAIGDCALIPNASTGQPAPPTAQFAVREAKCLAVNLQARLAGQPTVPFSYRARGMMSTVGHKKGVAELMGLPLTGVLAWLVWRAYYLSQMPTFGRKLRIFLEWSWGMFFATDITHLRFRRSHLLHAQDHADDDGSLLPAADDPS